MNTRYKSGGELSSCLYWSWPNPQVGCRDFHNLVGQISLFFLEFHRSSTRATYDPGTNLWSIYRNIVFWMALTLHLE